MNNQIKEIVSGQEKLLSESTMVGNRISHVKPLSQNELAQGWQLVVPCIRYSIKTVEGIVSKSSNIHKSKVNLAQLPRHLWSKMRKLRNDNYRVHDKSHFYFVDKSNVDDEIYELDNIIKRVYDINHKERVSELLTVLKDNEVYGWIVINATEKYML